MALITVYIPTRNRPALLLRAVASCLAQTETDFELLIVDDCSDSEHRQSIQSIAQLDRRIRIVQQAANLGACAARNIAIAQANGEFITGLDDDDEFTPDRLATFLALWRSKPQFAFLCSAARFQLNGGKTIKAFRGSKLIRIGDLLSANVVGNQVFTKTDYLRSVGGFDEQLPACQDYDAWVRLASRYGPGFRHEKATYIVRQDHLLPRISSSTKVLTGYQQFMRKHEQLMTPVQVRSQLFLQKLYGTNAGFFTLLAAAPLRMYPVALKVGLLRAVGYAL